ncbi:DUF4139 domain-containing protein [Corticibacter populi]|uniref:DUF4139 domain-containing protein n=2 Tax=Corticibacter populi TaxID=1550736 RepID=A0A3M6QJ60_9BURK|nr:DUF4139 domain-containing protein [Corticibacter populi]
MAVAGAAGAAPVQEKVSDAGSRQALAVTIYNESLALIREERQLPLDKGLNRIALREVSGQIMPQTASLRSLSGDPLQLLEQNFDFDLLGSHALLDKYVGRTVTVIRTHPATGKETREPATVLANNDGVVLQYADRLETGLPADARISFDEVPPNLRDRPTLVVELEAGRGGTQAVDLSYLTGGLSWQADYVATLASDESSLDLAGWVTLTNQSGTAYENAALQLVAGDVGRAPQAHDMVKLAARMEMMPAPAAAVQQEALFEYHLYTLPRPTTLRNNQTKQVALLSAQSVPVRKEYRLQGQASWYGRARGDSPELGDKRKVDVFVEFDNKEAAGLGMPLPKGIVRVYKADSQKRALFIGEDRIDHTAKNEVVRLKLGSAFDLNGTWKHLGTKVLADNLYEMAFRIELRNAKDVPATITVVEPIPGDWTMLEESIAHSKPTGGLAQWQVPVPANGNAVLNYKVRIRY